MLETHWLIFMWNVFRNSWITSYKDKWVRNFKFKYCNSKKCIFDLFYCVSCPTDVLNSVFLENQSSYNGCPEISAKNPKDGDLEIPNEENILNK